MAKRESALRFEVERWRARAEALTEENETFRASAETARRRGADAEGHFVLQSRELDRLRAQAVGDGAAQVARLEEQCARQRRMLRELAVASEALAKDNVLLSSELVALRDRGDEAESLAETLSERLRAARKLYLANQKSLARAEETRVSLPDGRWEKSWTSCSPRTCWRAEAAARVSGGGSDARAARRRRDVGVERPGAIRGGSFGPRAKAVPGALVQERRKLHEENAALRKSLAKARAEAPSCASGGRRRSRPRRRAARRRRQGADAAGAAGGRRAAPVVAGGARGRAGGVRAGEGRVRRVA